MMIKLMIKTFLVPPMNLIVGIFLLSLWNSRAHVLKWVKCFLCFFAGALFLLSTPIVSDGLMSLLQTDPALSQADMPAADAIVVLGSGIYSNAPEYGNHNLHGSGLERTRYAAKLYRDTHVPILVSGKGMARDEDSAEGVVMKYVLENEMKVPVRWVEADSMNTMENAKYSWRLLSQFGIRRIYLVTHAYHMKRSKYIFKKQGFVVVPAPTGFSETNLSARSFIPSFDALGTSDTALHEWVGLLWYRLKSFV